MTLCETITRRGRRWFLDGRRISQARADELRRDHDQDCFVTRCRRDRFVERAEVRLYSCLRVRP
jgi:hypothetical protein